jgi:chemotaxis protein methyltransferase CheR
MPHLPQGHNLSESEFTILRDLIHDRTGLYFENGKRQLLADKLSSRMLERQFRAFIDYYYLLRFGPGAEEEWTHVLDALSVQETYFWREMDQIRALVDFIAPRHFAGICVNPLRIWSAACATGEEPLTIAMALDQAGWFERGPIEIIASDGSRAALAKAEQGTYRERSFRALPTSLRDRYFKPTADGWQVDPELQQRVKWHHANLMDRQQIAARRPVHVIFCRNVFIYFSDDAIQRTLREFYDGLVAPGHLFVGVSESLLRFKHAFELQELGDAFVYVKPPVVKPPVVKDN